jgi:competence protein ComEA
MFPGDAPGGESSPGEDPRRLASDLHARRVEPRDRSYRGRMVDRSGTREPPRPRLRVGVGVAVLAVLAAAAVATLLGAMNTGAAMQVVPTGAVSTGPSAPEVDAAPAPRLLVHVLGAVRTPGLYELAEGSRLLDAVAAAGGLADDADSSAINLARRVADGEQLLVPRMGETVAPPDAASPGGGPVSLNSATSEQLQTLPRIGPSMADRIIAWRDAGGSFDSVEDLLEISGFGQKTVDALEGLAVP